ncbi:MAG: hypothetical protein M1820_006853 [Bogoriella megaspora]|nr:MAG: hypothetical protein M1820_006853 [Bogoriella megaspora]
MWTTTIPTYAHQYDYLIHSLLALSASHLHALTAGPIDEQNISVFHRPCASSPDAVLHRTHAIQSLANAIAQPTNSAAELAARIATALALTFQSSYFRDGLSDYFIFVRGTNLLFQNAVEVGMDDRFHGFRYEEHLERVSGWLRDAPTSMVNHQVLKAAQESLEGLDKWCTTDEERIYWRLLNKVVELAFHLPIDAYQAFVMLYTTPSTFTEAAFTHLITAHNMTGQLLLAHFVAIQQILTPILMHERLEDFANGRVFPQTAFESWVEVIWENLQALDRNENRSWRKYMAWPMRAVKIEFKNLFPPTMEDARVIENG